MVMNFATSVQDGDLEDRIEDLSSEEEKKGS
jgi:hypothetical protein